MGGGVRGAIDEHTALAPDEQGLDVSVTGDTIVVPGAVATPSMREAVGEHARELASHAMAVNDVKVPPDPEPDTAEDLG